MALVTRSFSDIITFTRASSATYFNSAGVLTTAGNNAPRLDYNPATLAPRGLLIEEQRTNSLTYSQQFDNAAWNKVNLNTTGTPPWVDVEVAPDGTTTADKIIEDTATGGHVIRGSVTPVDNTTYTFSVFAKAAERNLIQLVFVGKTGGFRSRIFDLSNGTSTQSTEAGYTTVPPVFGIQPVGNGWYRCWVGGDSLTGAIVTNNARIHLMTGTSSVSYTGDGTSGIYVWGAQLEAGAFSTSYIPTTGAAATRSADVASVNTLSPWFNATAGTLYGEFQWTTTSARNNSPLFRFDDGTNNNFVQIGFRNITPSAPGSISLRQGGGTTIETTTGNVATNDGAIHRSAGTYTAAQMQFSGDGNAPGTATPLTLPTVSIARIGSSNTGVATSYAIWIRRLTYYPRAFSSAELQAITA